MFQFETADTDSVRAVRFDFVKAVVPKPLAGSWAQLQAQLCIRKETKRKDQRALWSPVIYAPGTTRANYNVDAVTCLVVDMDNESFDHARLDGLEWMAYTTWSNRPDEEHWHLVLPLKQPVPAHRWSEVWTRLHERINIVGDPATKDPARIFYLPQYPVGKLEWSHRRFGRGEFLDAELDEVFVPTPRDMVRMPKAVVSRKPSKKYWKDEAWWNEPQDLSRFAGMTQQQIAVALRGELAELRKSLSLD
jgi:putative DNA primase/helicase